MFSLIASVIVRSSLRVQKHFAFATPIAHYQLHLRDIKGCAAMLAKRVCVYGDIYLVRGVSLGNVAVVRSAVALNLRKYMCRMSVRGTHGSSSSRRYSCSTFKYGML